MLRLPPSSPSPRSALRTRLSCPSSSPLSRRATSRRTRRPARSGVVASWVPRPRSALRSARRLSTTLSRCKGAFQWSDGRGCTYEWRTGIPKPDQGEINCLPPSHTGVDTRFFFGFMAFAFSFFFFGRDSSMNHGCHQCKSPESHVS